MKMGNLQFYDYKNLSCVRAFVPAKNPRTPEQQFRRRVFSIINRIGWSLRFKYFSVYFPINENYRSPVHWFLSKNLSIKIENFDFKKIIFNTGIKNNVNILDSSFYCSDTGEISINFSSTGISGLFPDDTVIFILININYFNLYNNILYTEIYFYDNAKIIDNNFNTIISKNINSSWFFPYVLTAKKNTGLLTGISKGEYFNINFV